MRYSSAGQSEQSIEGQRTVCMAFAEREGYKVVKEYIDRATSASHDTHKRKAFLDMIADSLKGTFDTVIVYKLDRFARNRHEAALYRDKLKSNGVNLVSASEPIAEGAAGILMEGLLESMAEYYSAELREKVRRGLDESLKKRKFLGGPVPLGYQVEDSHLVVNPEEARIVKELFQRIADGATFKEVSSWMKSQGFLNRKGAAYSVTTLSRMCRSKRYMGYYVYRDIEEPGWCEPIIDEELFWRTQKVIDSHRCKRHKNDFLLSGLVFCGHCGTRMDGESGTSATGRTYYYYKCNKAKRKDGCAKKTVRAGDLEDAVIKRCVEMLDDSMIDAVTFAVMDAFEERMAQDDTVERLEARLKDVNRSIDNAVNAVLAGVSPELFAAKLEELQAEKGQLEEDIEDAKARRQTVTDDMVRRYLYQIKAKCSDSDQEKARRFMVRTFVKRIELFDEDDGDGHRRMRVWYSLTGRHDDSAVPSSRSVANRPPFFLCELRVPESVRNPFSMGSAHSILENEQIGTGSQKHSFPV